MTVANDIEHLKDAFLFSEVKRWDVKGKSYFDYPMKYDCEDVGLLNARLNFREADPSHAMENVIYNELIARNCVVDVGVVLVGTVGADGKQTLRYHEIDFVVNRAPGGRETPREISDSLPAASTAIDGKIRNRVYYARCQSWN